MKSKTYSLLDPEGWLFVLLILLITSPEPLMGKRNRHNRAAPKTNEEKAAINKKNMENHELCVAGFCLPADYVKLNLPSSDCQHIKMNLEVWFAILTSAYEFYV